MDEAILDDRNADFAEHFLHVVAALGRQSGVKAEHVARGQEGVGDEFRAHLAVFDTGREADIIRTEAEVEQRTVNRGHGVGQFGCGDVGRLNCEIIQRSAARQARPKDVERHTACGAGCSVNATHLGGAARHELGGQRVAETARRNVALLDVGVGRTRIRIERIEVDVVGDPTANTAEHTERLTAEFRVTRTDVVKAEADRGLTVERVPEGRASRGAHRVQVEQTAGLVVEERAVDEQRSRNARRSRREFLADVVAHEREFRIGFDAVSELVVAIGANQVTLLRKLEVVVRREVVEVGRILEGPRTATGRVEDVARAACGEGAGRRGRRTLRDEAEFTTARKAGRRRDAGRVRRTDITTAGAARNDTAVTACTLGEFTLVLEHGITTGVVGEHGHRTAAIVERRTDGSVELVTGRIAAAGQRVAAADLETFNVAQLEVDDTGDRVRTVNGRGAAGHDFDAAQQELRDGVEVDDLVGIVEHPATAVNQHQGAGRAEVTQVQRNSAVAGVVREAGDAGKDLRQGVEHLLDIDRTGQTEFFGRNDSDRAGRAEIGARDTRTGDENSLLLFNLFGSGGGDIRRGVLSISRHGEHGTSHDRARHERSLVQTSHYSPLDARMPNAARAS